MREETCTNPAREGDVSVFTVQKRPTPGFRKRRILRYRHLIVRQMVQTKNRVSGLLLETGVEHTRSRLHKVGYFQRLMTTNSEIDDSIRPLLRLSREAIERCQKTEYALVSSPERDPLLKERIRRLRTVPGVGPISTELGTGDGRYLTVPIHQAGC